MKLIEDAGEDFEFGDPSGDQFADLEYFFAWLAEQEQGAMATAASPALPGLDPEEEALWMTALEEGLAKESEGKTSGRKGRLCDM